jgi:polysaccharide pyruvyl transferase WcaK-like protein
MPYITIFYGLPDTNPGGTALGIGLVNVLRKWFPNSGIIFMSSHGDKSILSAAHKFLMEKFPNLEIIPFPFMVRRDYANDSTKLSKIFHTFLWIYHSIKSLFCLIQPKLFLKNKSVSIFIKSKIVIGRGTNIFYDSKNITFTKKIIEFISLYNLCFPILLASRNKTPSVLYAQSFGPMHSSINKLLVSYTLKKCTLILSRENYSTDFLIKKLNVKQSKIKSVPDSVFALEKPSDSDVKLFLQRYELNYKHFAVFIPRLIKSKNIVSNELKIFSDIADNLMKNKIVDEIIVVTHCHQLKNYDRFESDEDIAALLFQELKKNHSHKIKVIDKSFSPDELFLLYGGAKFTFSARLHASIFSLISRTPTFAFASFGHKTRGIFEMIDLASYLINTENYIPEKLNKLLLYIKNNYSKEMSSINDKLTRINFMANQTPKYILDIIV